MGLCHRCLVQPQEEGKPYCAKCAERAPEVQRETPEDYR